VQTPSMSNIQPRVPFQNLTNINFSSPTFQGTHHFEAESSIRHIINHISLGWFQRQ
jgi:hypothetical protein